MKRENPVVEIFSQGEEIISGQTVDTNAAWLAMELASMGFAVSRHTAVGDRLLSLVSLLREVSERADCCICTGGLGPTSDDLTAQAVADAFDLELKLDEEALAQIEKHFLHFGTSMPEVNKKQAMLPRTSQRVDNAWGTAPGFALKVNRCWFAFLPGVPYEMKKMFGVAVKPALAERFNLVPSRLVTLRSVGLGESGIQERLDGIEFPGDVVLSFCAGALENQTRLLFAQNWTEAQIQTFVQRVAEAIGNPVFGIDGLEKGGGDLVEVIGRYLTENHQSLSVAETTSGGAMAARCAGFGWFREGLTAVDASRICDRLGLPRAALRNRHEIRRAVSTIASILSDQAATDFAIAQLSIRGVGYSGGQQSAICLHTAVSTPNGVFEDECRIAGRRSRMQTVAATRGLDMLRRYLQGYL